MSTPTVTTRFRDLTVADASSTPDVNDKLTQISALLRYLANDGTMPVAAINGLYTLARSVSAANPTTSDLPNDKDVAVHKNTASGNVYLAYNDSGTIKKVQLT